MAIQLSQLGPSTIAQVEALLDFFTLLVGGLAAMQAGASKSLNTAQLNLTTFKFLLLVASC